MITPVPMPEDERPPSDARELYARMVEWMRRHHPEWKARVEDPATVLIELWAEMESEFRVELAQSESRVLGRFLDALQIEPRGPQPARGVVRLSSTDPNPVPGRVQLVPALSRVSAPRRATEARVVFETACDCWVNHGSLVRVFATTRSGFEILPCVSGGSSEPRGEAVYPFGRESAPDRYLYLGDRRLDVLRQGDTVILEWAEVACPSPSDFEWEYHTRDGWRRLPARFEFRAGGDGSLLCMRVDGPLDDLQNTEIESANLPWLRAGLPGGDSVKLSIPLLRVGDDEEFVARCFAHSGNALEDLSFSSDPVQLTPLSDALQPTLFLGLNAAVPVSFYVEIEKTSLTTDALVEANPLPPRLVWEYADGDSWKLLTPERVRDRTRDLTRSGSVHLELNQEMRPALAFDERLVWIRARWLGGQFVRTPSVTAVHCNAVEVVQGVTLRDQVLSPVGGDWRGWIPVPDFPEGPACEFDLIVVKRHGREEIRQRLRSENSALLDEHGFLLRRHRDGKFYARFEGDGDQSLAPPPQAELRISSVRVGVGAHGNVPADTLSRVEHDGAPLSVEQIGRTRGGEDLESADRVRKRAALALRSEDRAVTRADYRRLVLSLFPNLVRVDSGPDSLQAGGVLVELVPSSPCGLSSVELSSLEGFLRELSVPGTSVRVVQRILEPASLEVVIANSSDGSRLVELSESSLGALGRQLREVLRNRHGSEKNLPAVGIESEHVERTLMGLLSDRREWTHLVFRSARIVPESGVTIDLDRAAVDSSRPAKNGVYYDLQAVRVLFDGGEC